MTIQILKDAAATVQAIWKARGLSPHRWRQFKLSNDPAFAEKLTDIVGLNVDPPAHAVVLSVYEKSQIQALDRKPAGRRKPCRRSACRSCGRADVSSPCNGS